jgi:hypothetical protein
MFFKGAHGLVVPSRHWYFFPTEKVLGPRGYERNEIIHAWWVTPSTRKFVFAFGPRDSFGAKSICVFCLETKGTNAEAPLR